MNHSAAKIAAINAKPLHGDRGNISQPAVQIADRRRKFHLNRRVIDLSIAAIALQT